MASELEIYCENALEITQEELWEEFGTPEEVTDAFLTEMGPAKLSRDVLLRSRCLCAATIALIVAVCAGSGLWLHAQSVQSQLADRNNGVEMITIREGDAHITALYLNSAAGPQYWEYNHVTEEWNNKPKPQEMNLCLSSCDDLNIVSADGVAVLWHYDPDKNSWTEVVPIEEGIVDRYYMYGKRNGPQYWEYNRENESWQNLPKPENLDIEMCRSAEVSYLTASGLYMHYSYDPDNNTWIVSRKMD